MPAFRAGAFQKTKRHRHEAGKSPRHFESPQHKQSNRFALKSGQSVALSVLLPAFYPAAIYFFRSVTSCLACAEVCTCKAFALHKKNILQPCRQPSRICLTVNVLCLNLRACYFIRLLICLTCRPTFVGFIGVRLRSGGWWAGYQKKN